MEFGGQRNLLLELLQKQALAPEEFRSRAAKECKVSEDFVRLWMEGRRRVAIHHHHTVARILETKDEEARSNIRKRLAATIESDENRGFADEVQAEVSARHIVQLVYPPFVKELPPVNDARRNPKNRKDTPTSPRGGFLDRMISRFLQFAQIPLEQTKNLPGLLDRLHQKEKKKASMPALDCWRPLTA